MSLRPTHALLLAGVVTMVLSGACALLSKSDPIAPRYFSPERPIDVPRPMGRGPEAAIELRLGRLGSAANLDEMLVFRTSPSEVGYYRLRRWTEAPEEYLHRRLARVLFEERGLREVVGGSGPTLDVQLVAFEELLAPQPSARVQVIVKLHDERLVTWEETVTVEQPIARASSADPADAMVEAMGTALRAAVDQIADRVVLELTATPVARVSR